MELTPIGWLLIPLGIISFIVKPRWLYVLTLFFAPFSATSIINTGGADAGQGFSPYLFFGFLLLLREFSGVVFRMKIRISHAIHGTLRLLYLFASVCLISLVMPLIINGHLNIISPDLNYRLVPLEYNWQVLNHALRLLFDIAITTVIVYRNIDVKNFYTSLRIYLSSGVFVCIWGIMQCCLFFLGIPYPAFIFNNSSTPHALGYGAVLGSVGLLRVSSVAIEPSFLSRVLVGMLAICFVAVRERTRIFSRCIDYIVMILLFVTILLSTSTSGYVGISVLLMMLLFVPSAMKKNNRAFIVIVFAVILSVVISYSLFPPIRYILDSELLNKNESGSAVERAVIIYYDLQYFLKYPILGIGWDCAPTTDVVAGMLATCGLMGLSSFLLLIVTILYKLKQNVCLRLTKGIGDNPSIIMFVCLLVTCAVYAISGGITVPDFWIILSLSIAAVGLGNKSRCIIRESKTLV